MLTLAVYRPILRSVEFEANSLFAFGYGGRLRIIDVTEKSLPVELGYDDPDNQIARSVTLCGDYVFIANSNRLDIVNINVPETPALFDIYTTNVIKALLHKKAIYQTFDF